MRNQPASLFAEMALPSCSSYVVALLAVAVYADLVLKPDSTGDQGGGLGAQGSGNGPQLQVSNIIVTLINAFNTAKLLVVNIILFPFYKNVTVPNCTSEEFLTANGTHFICRQLRKVFYILPNEPHIYNNFSQQLRQHVCVLV